MKKQLYEQHNGEYSKIFPLNYIQNLIDSESGNTLASILQTFNNIYLPYQNNSQDTRNFIPESLRRKGLWITYNNGEEYITEYFKGNAEDIQEYWTEDYNWEIIPDLKYVQDNASKLPNGVITPDKLSPALLQLIQSSGKVVNMADDEDIEEINSTLKFKDRKYNSELASGKGYKILRKNWTKVGGKMINLLTQDMINEANTIYEIRYDFDLNEKEITIPENCTLKFEGGSLDNGQITANNTKLHSLNDNIFGKDLILSGRWNCLQILANWFIADSDTQLFQKAFDFAFNLYNSLKGYYEENFIKVICNVKTYFIDDTIKIAYGISFNGNGATFKPTSNLINKYMFWININSEGNGWQIAYPGEDNLYFKYINYENPNSILSHFLYCGESIKISNISAFRPAKFITYTANYIDKKYINNCTISYPNTNFPLDENNFLETCSIYMGLGDSCNVNNIVGASIYIGSGANVYINGGINIPLYISNSRNISIRNIHNESGKIFVEVGGLSIEDSYFFASNDGNIKLIGAYNKYPELILKNCQFGNLRSLSDYNNYYPIIGSGKIICENVFGLTNNGDGGHNNDNYIGLKLNNKTALNVNKFIYSNGTIIEDNVELNLNNTIADYSIPSGTDFKIRIYPLADTNRQLFFKTSNAEKEFNVPENFTITCYRSDNAIDKLSNLVYRIEFANNDEEYKYYFDYIFVSRKSAEINIYKQNDLFFVNGLSAKFIDYEDNYIACSSYKKFTNNVLVYLVDNILPNKSLFNNHDVIYLKNGLKYTLIDNKWELFSIPLIEHSFPREVSNTWVKLFSLTESDLYDRFSCKVTLSAIHINNSNILEIVIYKNKFIILSNKGIHSVISKIATFLENGRVTYYAYINKSYYIINYNFDYINKAQLNIEYYDEVISELPSSSIEYSVNLLGTFEERPSKDCISIGYPYFCTDKQTLEGSTNGIMIYHKGNDVWADALGRVIK